MFIDWSKSSSSVIFSVKLIIIIQLSALTVCYVNEESLCENVDIRNNVTNLNKIRSCEVITGYLQIVLIEKFKAVDFEHYVFPKLRWVQVLIYYLTIFV